MNVLLNHPNLNRHRGVALMLVLAAIAVATIIAVAFLNAQSTSLGVTQNVNRHAVARAIAESAMTLAIHHVQTSTTWRDDHPDGAWVSDEAFNGGTFNIVGEDGEDTDADGVVDGDGDLTDDSSDLLTLTVTGKYEGVTHTLRTVVAPQAGDGSAVLIYGEQNDQVVRYRTWSGSAWSSEQSANDVGNNPQWMIARPCPTRSETAAMTLDSASDAYVQIRTDSTWSTPTLLSSNTVTTGERPMDMAYEQQSGKLLMVYRYGSTSGQVRYRTWDGTTMSSESTYTLPLAGDLKWVRLVPKAGTDEILMVALCNNNDVAAAVWDGSTWTNAVSLETDGQGASTEHIAAAYTGLTGNAVVAWVEDDLESFQYRTWNGTAWSAEADGPDLGKEPKWMKMAADPAGDKIILGTLDGSSDMQLLTWDGSSWSAPLMVETNAPDSDRRCFDVAFERGGVQALAVWGRSGQQKCFYRTYDGANWSNEATGPDLDNVASIPQLVTGIANDQIFVTVLCKSSGVLDAMLWNGASLSAPVELESNVSGGNDHESFRVASSGAITGGGGGQLIALYEFNEVSDPPVLMHRWKLDEANTGGGVATTGAFNLTGTALIDSYDSTQGAYGGANVGADAVISTNSTSSGDISMEVGTRINGDVYVGTGGNPNSVVTGGGTVTGQKLTQSTNASIPDNTAPTGMPASQGNKTYSSDQTWNSDMKFDDLTIQGSAIITINGNIRIQATKKLDIRNSASIVVPAGSSVTFYVGEDLVIENNTTVGDSASPERVTFIQYGAGKTIDIQNSGIVSARLYADSDINLKNSVQVFGSISTRGDIYMSNSAQLHLDIAQPSVGPAGTSARDSAGTLGGTYNGDVTRSQSGQDGTSVRFDGVNDYVLIPHDDDLLMDSGAVAFWFKSNNLSGHHGLFSKDSLNFDTGGHLHIYTDSNALKVRLQSTSGDNYITKTGLSTGQWYHVVFTWGGTGMKLFLNGVEVGTNAYTGGLGTTSGGAGNYEPLVLGAGTWSSDNLVHTPLNYYFDGWMDDVRIYDRQLDAAQADQLYDGDDPTGAGVSVVDTSGFGAALDLTIADPANVTWVPGGGLTINAATRIASSAAATKLHDALTATHELTIQVVFTPANVTQGGPARIVSYSGDGSNRNFTIGQDTLQHNARLRTTSTGVNGTPDVASDDVLAAGVQQTVIMTFDGQNVKLYRDGTLEETVSRSGDFSNWNNTYRLLMANEDGSSYPWLGTLHRVSIYDQALSAGQVANVTNGLDPGDDGASSTFSYRWVETP